jgi:type I restriction enzyme S subunit
MNAGWQNKRLGNLAKLNGRIGWRGLTAKEYTESGPLFLSVHSLNYGDYVDFREAFHISEDRYVESPEIMLQKDDVLICKDGAGIGKVGIVGRLPGRATINSSLLLIRSRGSILPKFLYRCLSSPYFQKIVNSRLNGATTPHLYQRDITEFPVVLPPLSEQQRIVGILDEALEGIATAKANAEKNLQNASALFENHLQSVFTQRGEGWVEKRLKDVCEKITDGTHQTPTYYDEGTIFLSSRNVTSGKIDWDKVKYIDSKQHLKMHKRLAPRINDILLAKNGTTGVAAIVDRDIVFDIYVSLALLRALRLIIPYFLLYFINSPVAKYQFNKRLKGSGVPNLHLQEIREVTISFPRSLAEQNSIVSKLDALSSETQRLESIYQQKLASLEALKKSLLNQAFRGQL